MAEPTRKGNKILVVFGIVTLIIIVLIGFGILWIVYANNTLQGKQNADDIADLENRVKDIENQQPDGAGWSTWKVITVIFIVIGLGVLAWYLARKFNVMHAMKRDKVERLLFEKLKNEYGRTGMFDGKFEEHRWQGQTGYYGAKAQYKWLAVTFSTLKKSALIQLASLPPKYTLYSYATSMKDPLEDYQGPYSCGVDELMESIRKSQYGHAGGGIFKEPTKSDLPMPDYAEEALKKAFAGGIQDAANN
jgi:hypothetical protein